MERFIVKLILPFFCFLIGFNLSAQRLTATDTSESSVKRYLSVIKNNRQLVSFIEYTFSQRGIPKHLRNLAIIESGLDRNIVSNAGAKGVWQFMTVHANQYGLSETQRSDMYKSTKAVANSLINLYNKYHNWITVVAAFNCGEGNIQKAINTAGSRKYTEFSPFLPAETQNHVKKYLNASYATGELNQVLEDYYGKNGTAETSGNTVVKNKNSQLKKGQTVENLSSTTLNAGYDLEIIAKYLKINISEILQWNPEIEKNLTEKGQSIFYLPKALMLEFEMNKNKIITDSLNK